MDKIIKSLIQDVSSWEDLMHKFSFFSSKEKGDAFEYITKLYFEIDAKYQFYDNIWLFSEVPAYELEILGLPSHDLGIDLIAKSGDEYHAIQCKFHYDNSKSITFKEVATFISLLESNPKLTQGYICSTADSTSHNFQKLKTKPINLILSDDWNKLEPDFYHQIIDVLKGKEPKFKVLKPREHQKRAIKDAVKYFKKGANSRGKLIFPCGSGKSLTGFWISQALKSKSTLIAVPSLSLIKQTLEVYLGQMAALNVPVKWLCICSDEGIGKDEDVAIYTENIGVPCQTDPVYIEQWLKKNEGQNIVVFTTYQSGQIIAEISKNLNISFEVGIFDEAHKTVGSNKKLFSHLLFEENICISKRIFMTATERFYQGSDDSIVSMDNTMVYGEVFAHMSFKEAIELELLTDYKVVTIEIGKSEVSDFIKQNNLVQLNDKWKKETEARSLASMLALRKAMELFPIKNAVSFHSSIDKAVRNKELQDYISTTYQFHPIVSYTVSGNQPTAKRNRIVQEFAKSERSLITNAKCLTEGVDVPNIDCIVFADPRKSKVDIVQAIGRALRKKAGKEWGYVVLPVVYDEETNEIDNENFNEIVAILRGLASNDSRIIEYFKDKNSENGSTGKESGNLFSFSVISKILDEKELEKQLEIKLWDKLSGFNWLPFEEAREFINALRLNSRFEYWEYCKTEKRPLNIPTAPERVYKSAGWNGWGDWLGTGFIAYQLREHRSFIEAKAFVKTLNFKTVNDWVNYTTSGKKPNDIPSYPDRAYEQWQSWGDWLGTGYISYQNREYKSFNEAREFVRKLNLKNGREWREYCNSGRKPVDIPTTPEKTYKFSGWGGFGDWLGTGFIANQLRKHRSFKEAREFVRILNLKNIREWKEFCNSRNKPTDIPSNPAGVYKMEWNGWGDWLGTGTIAPMLMQFKNFEEARDYVRKLKIQSKSKWKEFCINGKKPDDIPKWPDDSYKNHGWTSWGDFLGTETIQSQKITYRSFINAREFVRNLNLNNVKEWKNYCQIGNKPKDIPTNAYQTYKDKGWISWGDWLGSGTTKFQKKNFLSFKEARDFVRSLNLKNGREWKDFCKSGEKPENIPNVPNIYYKDHGWASWDDWFGKL